MKCSVCGNEFGNSANCQYCGVDRVTGLGNYNGYAPTDNSMDNKEGSIYTESVKSQFQTANVGSTVCYACGEIIPADSKFCPYCSKELFVTCPKCGNKYSSHFPACNQCGTNRELFEREHEELMRKEREQLERLQELRAITKAEEEREMEEYRKKWRMILGKDN